MYLYLRLCDCIFCGDRSVVSFWWPSRPALIFLPLFGPFRRGRPLIGGINKESNEVWKSGSQRSSKKAIPSRKKSSSDGKPYRDPPLVTCHWADTCVRITNINTLLCGLASSQQQIACLVQPKSGQNIQKTKKINSQKTKKKGQRMWQRYGVWW